MTRNDEESKNIAKFKTIGTGGERFISSARANTVIAHHVVYF